MVHILYAIRKGTAATKREETRRKKKRKKGRTQKKMQSQLGKPASERESLVKKKRKNEREVARSPLFPADSP